MPATALILSTPLKNGADQFTISDISAGNGEYVHNILLEALEIFAHLSNHHHFDYLINMCAFKLLLRGVVVVNNLR